VSIKTRSVKKSSALKGEMQCSIAPYGYVKGDGKLEIDEAASGVVREIFGMAEVKNTMYRIACTLTERRVPTSSEYYRKAPSPACKWSVQQISYILKNRAYIGDTVGQKYTRKSFKIKKLEHPPEDEWVVIPNTHEGIITAEQFYLVQEARKSSPYRGNKSAKKTPLFYGLLVCSDCGRRLAYFSQDGQFYYCCSGHTDRNYISEDRPCTPHYIRDDKLAATALVEINKIIKEFNPHDYKRPQKAMTEANRQLEKLRKREDELKVIARRMIEQNAKGILDDEMFEDMSKEYQTERLSNERIIRDCETVLRTDPAADARLFAELIKGRKILRALAREDVLKYIDKIVIYETDSGPRKRKGRSQLVEFHFKHVGLIGEPVLVA
jgi:hypothetical protein